MYTYIFKDCLRVHRRFSGGIKPPRTKNYLVKPNTHFFLSPDISMYFNRKTIDIFFLFFNFDEYLTHNVTDKIANHCNTMHSVFKIKSSRSCSTKIFVKRKRFFAFGLREYSITTYAQRQKTRMPSFCSN